MSGRAATENVIPGRYAISVGDAEMPCPPGWTWRLLTDVARLESGHTPSRNHPEWWGGNVPWIGIKDARPHHGKTIFQTVECTNDDGLANSAARLLPAGTVCLSRTASVGYVVVMGKEMATSQDFVNWVCSEAVVPDFLKYLFIAEKDSLLRFSKGTTHSTIYFPEVKAFQVCLPPPHEQKRIVGKIEALQARSDAAKEALDAIPPLLEKFRQSVLAAAFRGDLTKKWREAHPDVEPASKLLERIRAERRRKWEEANPKKKYVEPEPVDTDGLPELPAGWCWTTALEACAVVVDCHNKTAPYVSAGIPLIRTTNVRDGRIQLADTKFVDKPTYEFWSQRCPPRPGDVIFTREAPMGEVGMVPDGTTLCMGQRMMLLRADCDWLDPFFLLHSLQAPHVRAYAERVAVGSGVKHLRVRDVENLPIPVAPAVEQAQIIRLVVEAIAFHDSIRDSWVSARNDSDLLGQSILAKAFRGELVPQDPNDEPASALLERIRQQRENPSPTAATAPKSRGKRS